MLRVFGLLSLLGARVCVFDAFADKSKTIKRTRLPARKAPTSKKSAP